ncbi:MAG TPA: hypothetical protein VED86_01995 [archaeon]|nr:hypothetical protein [archaeon]
MKLDHLYAITDHNAVLQHAKYSVPSRREGYTTDDNARALVFAARAQNFWPNYPNTELQRKLLAFILLMQSDDGRFHNLMDFSQRIIGGASVGDHLGRAVWSAGAVIHSELPTGMKNSARHIFDRALHWGMESNFLRTKAYTCLGLAERLKANASDRNVALNLEHVGNDLLEVFERNATVGWEWFENVLTYDNARLSQALFAAYETLGKEEFLSGAEKSCSFLLQATAEKEIYIPIGNNGWYKKGGKPAVYDQQPVDAGAMVETMALAYKVTGREIYEKAFRQALGWFYGLNTRAVAVYDHTTGACYDGITPTGLNENQGSESTLSFLLGAATAIENFGQTASS